MTRAMRRDPARRPSARRRLGGKWREGGGRARTGPVLAGGRDDEMTPTRRDLPCVTPELTGLFHAAAAGRFTETSHAGAPHGAEDEERNTCIQTELLNNLYTKLQSFPLKAPRAGPRCARTDAAAPPPGSHKPRSPEVATGAASLPPSVAPRDGRDGEGDCPGTRADGGSPGALRASSPGARGSPLLLLPPPTEPQPSGPDTSPRTDRPFPHRHPAPGRRAP